MPVIFGTRLGVVMCIVFFRKNVSEKDKREFEEYKRHCEECREYEQKHANQHDRVERH